MNKDKLQDYIDKGLSQRQIGSLINKSQSSVKYWLKKYNLKTKSCISGTSKVCPCCNEDKSLNDFYSIENRAGGLSSYCKKCVCNNTIKRQRNLKQLAVDYKGGACIKCGYNKCLAALEFHHLDPTQKDFAIGKKCNTNLTDSVKAELDKCVLLCANCHREEHNR